MDSLPPYAVALKGWPELPTDRRIAAEIRYAEELERMLGSAEKILEAWWEHYGAEEARDGILNEDSPPLVSPFTWAQESAERAGWLGLENPPKGAGFKVWVEGEEDVYETEGRVGSTASDRNRAVG
jgi:hypothetical protein